MGDGPPYYLTCSVDPVKAILVALVVLLGACASEVPSSTIDAEATTTVTLSYAAEGALLYDAHCALCHGPEGVGNSAGPAMTDEIYLPDQTDDVAMLLAVTDGVDPGRTDFNGMAAITHLSHSDIARITAYIRDLQE